MPRSASERTQAAADALLAWLGERSGVAQSPDQRPTSEPGERSAEDERHDAATPGEATGRAAASRPELTKRPFCTHNRTKLERGYRELKQAGHSGCYATSPVLNRNNVKHVISVSLQAAS